MQHFLVDPGPRYLVLDFPRDWALRWILVLLSLRPEIINYLQLPIYIVPPRVTLVYFSLGPHRDDVIHLRD